MVFLTTVGVTFAVCLIGVPLFLLFVRFLPMIPMSEIRMMLPQTKVRPGESGAKVVNEEAV